MITFDDIARCICIISLLCGFYFIGCHIGYCKAKRESIIERDQDNDDERS